LLSQTLFLHGGNEFHTDSAEFDQFFVDATFGARVGIFPGASTSERDRIATVAFASGYFSLYGLELIEVSPEHFHTIDALILPGGSPNKLLDELLAHKVQLLDLLDRGVIYGASAGAMVLGRGFEVGGSWRQALELGPFQALVHFQGRAPERGRPGLIYGLPEAGGLVVARSGEILTQSSGVQIWA
jgi:peptidase E